MLLKEIMGFKESFMSDEFDRLDHKLKYIVYAYALRMYMLHDNRPTITSVFRPENKASVHSSFRGCDVRTRDMDAGHVAAGVAFINGFTVYDPQRPEMKCAVYKLTGKEAAEHGAHEDHVHFQVHPNTQFVVKEA